MDEYLFQEYLDGCTKVVGETTTFFEAFVFEDEMDNILRDEREVSEDELEALFSDFRERPKGCLGGIRLMLEYILLDGI
jgi:hypothetical protein